MLLVDFGKQPRRSPNRNDRLSALISAAAKTDFYRTWLTADVPASPFNLELLPYIEIGDFYGHKPDFLNRYAPRAVSRELNYPIQQPPKIAVLADGFRRTAHVRMFADFELEEIAQLDTETIAAPVEMLRRLAKIVRPQQFPLVAFTGIPHGLLTDSDRNLFWKAYGVPVFEQFCGLEGEVLAEECEAHDGLHIRTGEALFEQRGAEIVISSFANLQYPVLRLATGFTGDIDDRCCPCGRPGERLSSVRRKPRKSTAQDWSGELLEAVS